MTTPTIYAALASFPGRSPHRAMLALQEGIPDPVFTGIAADQVQICPQNCIEQLTPERAEQLREAFPDTRFRLHANVRVLERHIPVADLSRFSMVRGYFREAAAVSRTLRAPAYTLHAGRREGRFENLFRNADRLEREWGVPVGIEGHYPTVRNSFWIAKWAEYERLYASGRPFVVDLSHLNIVAHHEGRNDDLVVRMLASPNCIEVHVSDNDGTGDQHRMMNAEALPWWWPLLDEIHPNAAIFYEGNLRSTQRRKNA